MNKQPAYTVVGAQLSTFTRTVILGLRHKGLEYNLAATAPHSPVAFAAHPFGYLPALIVHDQGNNEADITICESQAIARYIERVAPEPSLDLVPKTEVAVGEKMWEFLSFIVCYGVQIIEDNVVKFRIRAEGRLTEDQIQAHLEDGPISELKYFLKVTEGLMAPTGYILGDRLTWADFFLYPLMADLETAPERDLISSRIKEWMDMMSRLPEVQATVEGTMASGAKLPNFERKRGHILRLNKL